MELTPFTVLKAEFKERRKGEEKYLSVHALGREKVPALQVELVVYDRVTLGEDATSQADYEIVSVNARGTTGPEPMSPVAMMRNFLGLSGGTETVYTAEQFAEAIRYWSTHVMCGE